MRCTKVSSAETFTQNYDQYLAKISGRVVAMFDQYWLESAEKVLTQEEKYTDLCTC